MIIEKRKDLQSVSTFGLKAHANYFLQFQSDADLLEISDFINELNLPSLTLGGGSNMIFCADYPGVVIQNKIDDKAKSSRSKITVSAGVQWDDLVSYAIDQGLSGIEALSGIPGTVGGAIALNAGAYGENVKSILDSVRVYDVDTRKLHSFDVSELKYWHRSSIFREKRGNDWIIVDASFKLPTRLRIPEHPKIQALSAKQLSDPLELRQAVLDLRGHMPNPYQERNAGSFFLNPTIPNAVAAKLRARYPDIAMRPYDARHEQIAAGWLLDQAGLKGTAFGNFAFHEQHANIVVNTSPHSTGKDLLGFIGKVQELLYNRFGIHIVAEPLLVGEEYLQGMLSSQTVRNIVHTY